MKALIFIGVVSATIALATQTNAFPHVNVDPTKIHDNTLKVIHQLPFINNESYLDGYDQIHRRKDNGGPELDAKLRKWDANGLITPDGFCRIAMDKLNAQPHSLSDWLHGCADALHDDLGL